MLTIFACPKPFTDPHIAIIQRNAITSWTLLRPRPEIILFGDEAGVAEICRELGLRHVPKVARNEFGTPLLNDIFFQAQRMATHDLLCYINADVILMGDFMEALRQVQGWSKPFLLAGEKRDVEIASLLDYRGDWETELCARVQQHYLTHKALIDSKAKLGAEYFVFRRGLYNEMPPLLVGRWAWDGWLLWQARRLGADVIDATPVVLAAHQIHDHAHIRAHDGEPWRGQEAQRNVELAGIKRYWFLREATHLLTADGPRRLWGEKLRYRLRTGAHDLVVYRLGRIRHALGLRRVNLSKLTKNTPSRYPQKSVADLGDERNGLRTKRAYCIKTKLLVLLFSCILSLTLAELALRVVAPELGADIFQRPPRVESPYVYSEAFGYEFKPFATSLYDSAERLNSDGFRGPERRIPKPSDTFRILAVGDSVVEAAGPYSQTWEKVLEDALNQIKGSGFRSYEVINAGVMGHTSRDALLRLQRRGLKYAPDLVIIFVGWNDLVFSTRPEWYPNIRLADIWPANMARAGSPSVNSEANSVGLWQQIRVPLYRASYVARLVRQVRISVRERWRIESLLQERRRDSGLAFNEAALRMYVENLEAIYEIIQNSGSKMALVFWPTIISPELVDDEEIRQKLLFHFNSFPLSAREYWEWYNRYLMAQKDFSQRHPDIIIIDAASHFAQGSKAERLEWFSDLVHLTESGNREFADMVFQSLKNAGLIP